MTSCPPARGAHLDAIRNILTVDLEEWFHIDELLIPVGTWDGLESRVEENTRALLALLDACGVRATFFALGWVAARHQSLILEIHERGHEIATHGYLHRTVASMTPAEFRADLQSARLAVEGCCGGPVLGHRAARWSLGGAPGGGRRGRASGMVTEALDVLIGEGIRYDASLAPIVHIGDPSWPRDPYSIERPGGSIVELPPLVGRFIGVSLLFASGWALRRVPNRVLLREIERRNRRGVPAVIDVHTWELDPGSPRVRLPFMHRLAHYGGLRGFDAKLAELLRSVPWSPARDHLVPPAAASIESPNRAARIAKSEPSTNPFASTSAAAE
ncbi:MAG TPA: polysaccharide deacetylase family protein [Candidatus Dormibacteraeota bacterium]|nr:polysaccharide deacetylase family protein [Candidatus Dormibacteraeota bacterium]